MAAAETHLVPMAPPMARSSHPTHHLAQRLAVAGWASLALVWASGSADVFGHEQGDGPALRGLLVFLVGWSVMVAAMMLPSSLPTFRRVDAVREPSADRAALRLMAGYFVAWAGFGAVAFAADRILHVLADTVPLLAQRPSLVIGSAAVLAGAAELLGRTPPPSVPDIASDAAPFVIGKVHAADRIRRCWPVMLFAMAIGMSAIWMVVLTIVMSLELRPRAGTLLRYVGLALLVSGVAVVIEPRLAPLFLNAA